MVAVISYKIHMNLYQQNLAGCTVQSTVTSDNFCHETISDVNKTKFLRLGLLTINRLTSPWARTSPKTSRLVNR